MNQVVAQPRPLLVGGCVADVMTHRRSTRRKDCQVGAARRLECELRLHTLSDLIVTDVWQDRRLATRQPRNLCVPESLNFFRHSRVVAMTIDNHVAPSLAE